MLTETRLKFCCPSNISGTEVDGDIKWVHTSSSVVIQKPPEGTNWFEKMFFSPFLSQNLCCNRISANPVDRTSSRISLGLLETSGWRQMSCIDPFSVPIFVVCVFYLVAFLRLVDHASWGSTLLISLPSLCFQRLWLYPIPGFRDSFFSGQTVLLQHHVMHCGPERLYPLAYMVEDHNLQRHDSLYYHDLSHSVW